MGQQWGPGWRICLTFISFIFISKISADICAVPLTRGSTKRAGTFLAPESPQTPLGACWDPTRTPLGSRWDPHSSPCPWGRASAGLVAAERAARAGLSCAWFRDDGSHGELAAGLVSPQNGHVRLAGSPGIYTGIYPGKLPLPRHGANHLPARTWDTSDGGTELPALRKASTKEVESSVWVDLVLQT